jgi:hypothetical protein
MALNLIMINPIEKIVASFPLLHKPSFPGKSAYQVNMYCGYISPALYTQTSNTGLYSDHYHGWMQITILSNETAGSNRSSAAITVPAKVTPIVVENSGVQYSSMIN